MKLIIFGATGTIGLEIVKQAIEKGYEVTAFVRNPSKINITHKNLSIVQGDVMNFSSVEKAVQGQDVVFCALGAGSKGIIRSEGTKNIIQAMENQGVKRFICQTTLGVGESRGNLNFFWKYIMFGLILRKAYQDHIIQEEYIKQSNLEWTIIRPGAFIDGDKTGNYKHGFPGTDKTTKLKISRSDVADFMLKQLKDITYLYKSPGLSY